jgi:hypothetical protein
MPTVELSGDAFLMVIQNLQGSILFGILPFRTTLGQLDPDGGKEKLFRWLNSFPVILKSKRGANIRLRVS